MRNTLNLKSSAALILVTCLTVAQVLSQQSALAQTGTSIDGIVASARTIKWRAADDQNASETGAYVVGVPGGIDSHNAGRSVVNVPAPSGGDDTAVIQSALDAAPQNTIVKLQAGTYRISGLSIYHKDNVTLRGAGIEQTILDCRNSGGTCLSSPGYDNNGSALDKVVGGLTKGNNRLVLENTVNIAGLYHVGDMVQVVAKNDLSIPIVQPYGFRKIRNQLVRIASIDPSNHAITINPALMINFKADETYVRRGIVVKANEFDGFEDFTVDGSISGLSSLTPQVGIAITVNYGSWIRNVKIKGVSNYPIEVFNNINCEVRHNILPPTTKDFNTSNGAGILLHNDTSCLFEDNIAFRLFPIIEINESAVGNVFAYNYFGNGTTNTNHGAPPSYNLFEGNVASYFQSDGYFGGEFEETFFRNRVVGGFSLKRFSRNFNIIGNLLSTASNSAPGSRAAVPQGLFESRLGAVKGAEIFAWLMSHGYTEDCHGIPLCTSQSAWFVIDDLPTIGAALGGAYPSEASQVMAILERTASYEMGRPNIGNVQYDGFAQPSQNKYWKDWDPTIRPETSGLGIVGTVNVSRDDGTHTYVTVTIDNQANFDRLYGYAVSYCSGHPALNDINHPSDCQHTEGIDWGSEDNYNSMGALAFDVPNRKVYLIGSPGYPIPPVSGKVGIWPRSEGFQEMDLDVESTTIAKGNWRADGASETSGHLFTSEALSPPVTFPTSLYRTGSTPPAFWTNGLAWPPYNPQATTPNLSIDAIPAGQRFVNGGFCGGAVDECDAGTWEDVPDVTGKYLWNCRGADSTVDYCSLSSAGDAGQCPADATAPSSLYSCTKGTLDTNSKSYSLDHTTYTWVCQGLVDINHHGASVHCSYVNKPPSLTRVTTTSDLTNVVANSKITFTLEATDDYTISTTGIYVNSGGVNTPINPVELKKNKPTHYVGTNQWSVTVDWTPSSSGSYVLYANVVDDLGAESDLKQIRKATLNSDPNLTNWWKLGEGTGTTAFDSSTRHNNGTISGSGAQWVQGRDGKQALYFSGSSNVTAALNITSYPMTVCAWVKPAGSGGITQNLIQMAGYVLGVQSNGYSGDAAQYFLNLGNNSQSVYGNYGSITANVWQHVCGTISAKHEADDLYTASIYVNGDLLRSVDNFTTFSNVGSISVGPAFVGAMSDVRLYRRELTPSEVTQLYSNPPKEVKPTAPGRLRVVP